MGIIARWIFGIFSFLCVGFWWWWMAGDFAFMHAPPTSQENHLLPMLLFLGYVIFVVGFGILGALMWKMTSKTDLHYKPAYILGMTTALAFHWLYGLPSTGIQWVYAVVMFLSLSMAMYLLLQAVAPPRQRASNT